jgi:hypothetical protein
MSILQSSKLLPLRSTIDIKIQFELTFVHLRYSLGGDRPSQTTNHTLSIFKILVIYFNKSGISRLFKQFTSVKVLLIPTYATHIR